MAATSERTALRLVTVRSMMAQHIRTFRDALHAGRMRLTEPFWVMIAPKIAALDPDTVTVADLRAVRGDRAWTELVCSACGREVPAVVEIDADVSDPDQATASVCRDCLRAALALFPPD